MDIIEHNGIAPLIALIDDINRDDKEKWIIACIRREYLKTITNEAFILTIKPAMQKVDEAHVYFSNGKNIYVAWKGDLKGAYKQMRAIVAAVLVRPGIMVAPTALISYVDPHKDSLGLKMELKDELWESEKHAMDTLERTSGRRLTKDPLGWDSEVDEDNPKDLDRVSTFLSVTEEQIAHFMELKNQRRYQKQMHVLIVEDQVFSQKLLCDIIRGARTTGLESPSVDMVEGLESAWGTFLKNAHDIAFIDLNLSDGSGHALARAIKELDPATPVIIVTANNYQEEISVARQNNVDGFIAKPYNKKQILDCIDKFVGSVKIKSKGASRGSANQF